MSVSYRYQEMWVALHDDGHVESVTVRRFGPVLAVGVQF